MSVKLNEKQKMLIFINLMITGIATSMLVTAMTTALPPVVEYFGISMTTGQWMTSGYSLAMGIVMPLTAFLIKKISTRKLYISSIICFIIGELVCIFAPGFSLMMVGRVLQAIGNGILTAMGQVIILSIYPEGKKGAMMGWYGLASTAAPIIAPTIAGVLVDTVGWKYIFIYTMVVMLVSLVMSVMNFSDVLELQDIDFDIRSFVLSIFAFGGITLGIGNIGSYGITSLMSGLPLIIGLFGAVFFVYRQLKLEKAFLDIRILKKKEYSLAVISSMLLYLVMMGGSVLMPLYVQSVLGYSAVTSALVTLPGSVATAVINPFAGRIYDRVGIKKLYIIGSICLLISNIGMYFVTLSTPLIVAAIFNVIRNVSIGCLMMPLLTWGTSQVSREKVADASSLLTSLRTVAGSIGSAVFVAIMSAVAVSSETNYGTAAAMHGVNIAFVSMSIATLIMVGIALFGIRKKC
ncbi:DHA2 family efflux MFS transporter permease subunit [Butyricicoccus sp.]|uniref:DHA2 family efflux MFS transporter permease subunit n=1 Tax=Butyricicoccus sp. TaxID=2049021 RepID=UPI003F15FA29